MESHSNTSYLDDFQKALKVQSSEKKPYWLADKFRTVFHRDAPMAHWYLLHRAISYRMMYLDGKLSTYKLKKRFREAFRLRAACISEKDIRMLVEIMLEEKDARMDEYKMTEAGTVDRPEAGAICGVFGILEFDERISIDG